ncbi:hypothetical protein Zm00014a_030270 [Zea mays]|uniref:Glutathione S-transferase T3 n=1 Tax=Zea mays TaxID=4577 RepID=A0A3L6FPU1_MAIZE|nr:hypothetical protein Zm00014a_030270 [Zea mays]
MTKEELARPFPSCRRPQSHPRGRDEPLGAPASCLLLQQHQPLDPLRQQRPGHLTGGHSTAVHPPARASPITSIFSSLNTGSSPSFSKLLHRKETRLIWKSDEDVRVMSAWLKHSIDSLSGNNKKGDKYWEDVANDYNLTTKKIRWRTKTQKAAKKAAYDATDKVAKKGAKKAVYDATDKVSRLDELNIFEKIQNGCHANSMKVLEMQQKISNDKIEASKLSLQAAKDEKEARLLEKESKMLETYSCLLKKDMSAMHDEIRAEHIAALKM